MKKLLLPLLILLLLPSVCWGTEVIFQQGVSPTGDYTGCEDNMIGVTDNTTNYGDNVGIATINMFAPNWVYRTLIKFDISSIPAGATINSAVLNIYSTETDGYGGTISAFRVLRNWVEMESTWNIYSTGNNWGTAGCDNTTSDRGSTALDTYVRTAWDGVGWWDFDITTACQNWFNSTWANYGVIFVVTSGTISDDQGKPKSSEYTTDTSLRPKLIINYTTAASTTWGPWLDEED